MGEAGEAGGGTLSVLTFGMPADLHACICGGSRRGGWHAGRLACVRACMRGQAEVAGMHACMRDQAEVAGMGEGGSMSHAVPALGARLARCEWPPVQTDAMHACVHACMRSRGGVVGLQVMPGCGRSVWGQSPVGGSLTWPAVVALHHFPCSSSTGGRERAPPCSAASSRRQLQYTNC